MIFRSFGSEDMKESASDNLPKITAVENTELAHGTLPEQPTEDKDYHLASFQIDARSSFGITSVAFRMHVATAASMI